MQAINNEYHNNVHVKPKTKWEGILTQMKYFKKIIEILFNQKLFGAHETKLKKT